jgi:hypothetical protein
MNDETERITHAAVFTESGLAVRGRSHAECYEKCHKQGLRISKRSKDQGFKTNKRHFVSRVEAAEIAFMAFQIEKPTNILFSEDLWDKEHGGKYDYNEDIGYHLQELEVRSYLEKIHDGDSEKIASTLFTPLSAFGGLSINDFMQDNPDSSHYVMGTLKRIYFDGERVKTPNEIIEYLKSEIRYCEDQIKNEADRELVNSPLSPRRFTVCDLVGRYTNYITAYKFVLDFIKGGPNDKY